jgi:DNA polymerase-3 subunit alpha (Gram-positive type)
MDNVKENPKDYPFSSVKEIPFTDKKVIALLREDSDKFIDSLGISEFGTNFVTNMLHEINPKTFADLVKVSGLSHGTDVWNNNSQELVNGTTDFGKIKFSQTIGCRDDIMVQLMEYGLEPSDAFDIMEFVRKGKLYKGDKEKWETKFKPILKEHNVPDWYIWSCEQIKYMFPKAHAVAYVLSALRIAWFKAYKPLEFYQAMFTVRADQFDVPSIATNDVDTMLNRIDAIREKGSLSASDEETIHFIELAIEMVKKGFRFKAPRINDSDATKFLRLDNKTLLIPFSALKGVGESMALKICNNRTTPYTSLEDFKTRGGANKKVIDALTEVGTMDLK